MGIFDPSIYLAVFPYLFISSFPIFGIFLVTKLMYQELKKRNIKNI
jgi:uncharacterized protein YneF (UPF0154 family)